MQLVRIETEGRFLAPDQEGVTPIAFSGTLRRVALAYNFKAAPHADLVLREV